MKISDHVTVIRLGKVIGTVKTSETTPEELTRMMVGRDISLGGGAREEIKSPKEILKIDHVSYKNTKNIKKVDD